MKENNYYVYVYLDPRKPGKFVYEEYNFEYEPIYIGKGTRRRMWHHLQNRLKVNKPFYAKLNKIIKLGHEPIFYKLIENISEENSLEYEKKLITLIGRVDLETGSLCNMTEGGDKGFSRTLEARKKLSLSKMGEKNPQYGKTTSDKQKEAVRQAHKEGRIKLTEKGRQNIINYNKNKKGKKNINVRKDIKKYRLIDLLGNEYIIEGARRLQNFCSEKQIRFHILVRKVRLEGGGIIIQENLNQNTSNKLTSKNTLGWQIEKS